MGSNVVDIKNDFKGYSLFNEIEDLNLQSWNRAATMFNMCSEGRKDFVRGYIDQLSPNGRRDCYIVLASINANGYEQTKRDFFRTGGVH